MAWKGISVSGVKALWSDFQGGVCLGGRGTDNGTVVLDKECSLGARVTLEEGGLHPWTVTCGVGGALFVHGMRASSRAEAESMARAAMEDIGDFLERMESDEVSQADAIRFAGIWTEAFTNKYDSSSGSWERPPLRGMFPVFSGAERCEAFWSALRAFRC